MPPIAAPALLPPNPVWRSYVGGRELRRFRGASGAADDHFPEDWLASTVRARNGENSQHPLEGLSRVADSGGDHLLIDQLNCDPKFWFGPNCDTPHNGNSPGVLWKL